jgi:hypothetical protein
VARVRTGGWRARSGAWGCVHSMCRLLVTASVVPSSPILVTPMKEALSSSETSVLTRATCCSNPEDAVLLNLINYKIDSVFVSFRSLTLSELQNVRALLLLDSRFSEYQLALNIYIYIYIYMYIYIYSDSDISYFSTVT